MLFGLGEQVLAYRMLHDPQIGGQAGAEQVLELCKAAGYCEDAAQKAARQRADQRLDAEQPMFGTTYVHQ